MPVAIQELSKSLIFKNVYSYKGRLIVYNEIHETEKSAKLAAIDRGEDKYMYTIAQEVIKLPND